MSLVQKLTFATVVLIIVVFITKYFLFSLVSAFPNLKRFKKGLNLLYVFNLVGFILFQDKIFLNTKVSEIFATIIYLYFTFMFVFVAYGVFFEILILARRCFANLYEKKISVNKRRLIFAVVFLMAFNTVVGGWLLARNIVVKNIEVKNPKIAQYTRVVQISDLHFSKVINEDFAKTIVPVINSLNPDIVVVTGDYMDRGITSYEMISRTMDKITAPLGKYAISGNHEFHVGYINAIKFIEKNDFEFMDGIVQEIGRNIAIGGVMDKSASAFNVLYHGDEKVLRQFKSENFNIYLKHRPELKEGDSSHFDLMLSGHTHGGQIFPFIIPVKFFNKYLAGLYELENGAKLYVSRGTGSWGPPVRFGATPEITLIELIP